MLKLILFISLIKILKRLIIIEKIFLFKFQFFIYKILLLKYKKQRKTLKKIVTFIQKIIIIANVVHIKNVGNNFYNIFLIFK